MKYCLFIILLTTSLSSCYEVNKILISEIQIEKVEISERNIPDSLLLDHITLDSFTYSYDRKNKTLFIDSFRFADPIIINKSTGDSLIKNPSIDFIDFKSKTVRNPSEKYTFKLDTIIVRSYVLKTIELSTKLEPYNDNIIRNKELDSLLTATKNRLDSLIDVLEDIIKKEPENSMSTVINSSYFNDLRGVIDETTKYLKYGPYDAGKSEFYLKKIGVVNLRLDSIEEEINNPYSHPIFFSNDDDLYFDLGEFKIDPTKHMSTLNEYISQINMSIDSLRPITNNITIVLRAIGFSDDISISDSLKDTLLAQYDKPMCNEVMTIKQKQTCLNLLLSEQRSISVLEYITKRVEGHCLQNNINIKIIKEPIGYGIEYPSKTPINSCPGDCKSRRTVSVSRSVLSN